MQISHATVLDILGYECDDLLYPRDPDIALHELMAIVQHYNKKVWSIFCHF